MGVRVFVWNVEKMIGKHTIPYTVKRAVSLN